MLAKRTKIVRPDELLARIETLVEREQTRGFYVTTTFAVLMLISLLIGAWLFEDQAPIAGQAYWLAALVVSCIGALTGFCLLLIVLVKPQSYRDNLLEVIRIAAEDPLSANIVQDPSAITIRAGGKTAILNGGEATLFLEYCQQS